jgi:hypothetical protein
MHSTQFPLESHMVPVAVQSVQLAPQCWSLSHGVQTNARQ